MKVTLPPMPLQHAEQVRKITQRNGGAVTYIIKGSDKKIIVEVEKHEQSK